MWKSAGRITLLTFWSASLVTVAARGEIEVHGRVQTAEGRPVTQARIALIEAASPFEEGTLLSLGKTYKRPVVTTSSDQEGRFRIAAPAPGMWTVLVEAPGTVAWEYPLPLVEPLDLPTVTLRKSRDVGLRVVDGEGKPIPGALAGVTEASRWDQQLPASGDWWPAAQVARADEAGRLVVSRASTKSAELLVWAPGFLEARLPAAKSAATDVTLVRGSARHLQVRRADGEPASGVQVRVGEGRWPAGRTDEHGRLTLAVPAHETLALEFVSEASRIVRVLLLPAAPPGGPGGTSAASEGRPAAFSLPPERWLEGEVVDARSRDGVPGAWVWIVGDRPVFTRADSKGSYSLPVTDPGASATVVAEAPGYLRRQAETATLHGSEGLTLVLEGAAALPGEVVDESGRPVAGVEIEANGDLTRNHLLEPPLPVAARSDEKGRFRLSRLAAEQPYELIARAPGFAPMRVAVPGVAAHTSAEPVRLVLRRGQRVVGEVRDPYDAGVPEARVVLYPSRSSSRGRLLKDDVHGTLSERYGRFELTHVLAGNYDVGVSAPGFAPALVRGVEIVDGASPFDLGTVVLDAEAALSGRVTDPHGQGLEGVTISYVPLVYEVGPHDDQLSIQRMTRTGAEGEFVLGGFRYGEQVDLKLRRSGYLSRQLFAVEIPGDDVLTVVLEPALEVSGHVVTGERQPVAQARVTLEPLGSGLTTGAGIHGSGGRGRTVTAGEDGAFSFRGVPLGTYSLSAYAEGYVRSDPAEVEVLTGRAVEELSVVLEPGAKIAGRLVDETGRAVIGARIEVLEPQPRFGEARGRARTQSDGSYQIEGLATGPLSLEIRHPRHPSKVLDLRLRAGFNRVDLVLDSGFEVSGRVVDNSRSAVAGAAVRLSGPGTREKKVTSGPGGAFSFLGVPAGTYEVRASLEGYAEGRAHQPVEVAGAPAAHVEVVLTAGGSVVGRVLGLDFDDLSGVEVSASGPSGDRIGGRLGYEGDYRIDHLAAGEWTVTAVARDRGRRVSERLILEDGASETWLDLDFESGLSVSGEVSQGGRPVSGALVVLARQGAASARDTRTTFDGRFELWGLEAGAYELTVAELASGLYHTEVVEVTADRTLVVDLATAEVRGRVLDAADGAPVPNAAIELEPAAWRRLVSLRPGTVSDVRGFFEVRGFTAGQWRLRVRKDGFAAAEHVIDVEAGAPASGLEIELEAETAPLP